MDELYVPQDAVVDVKLMKMMDILSEFASGVLVLSKQNGKFLILDSQRGYFELAGTDSKNIRGRYFDDLFPAYVKAGKLNIFDKVYDTGEPLNFKTYFYIDGKISSVSTNKVVKFEDCLYYFTEIITAEEIREITAENLFNTSLLAIMETNSKKEVIRINNEFSNLTGYSLSEINGIGFENIIEYYNNLNPMIKSYMHGFNSFFNEDIVVSNSEMGIRTKSGELKWVNQISSLVYADDLLIQSKFVDVTEAKEAEINARYLEENLNFVAEYCQFALIIGTTDTLKYSDELLNITGLSSFDEYENNFFSYIFEEDRMEVIDTFRRMTPENPESSVTFRIRTPKEDIKHLCFNIVDIYSDDIPEDYSFDTWGFKFRKEVGFERSVIMLQDLTDVYQRENVLEKLNAEKEVLLKEIHHRVKNNLQLLNSFLNLENRFANKSKDELLNATKSRIESIALLHEKTYNSPDLVNINVKEYTEDEFNSFKQAYIAPDIKVNIDIDENIDSTLSKLTSLGLIYNELFTNTLKHAFDKNSKNKEVSIICKDVEDELVFIYKDNGKGFTKDFDISKLNSLGFTVIRQLILQLEGSIELIDDGLGATFRFKFPKETL